MFHNINRKFVTVALLCITLQALALNSDKTKPAYVSADDVQYKSHSHVSIYRGHVKFDQGTTHLIAHLAFVYNTPDNKIEKIIAIGSPAHYSTLPEGQHTQLNAAAKTIEYIPKKGRAFLIGNAKLLDNGNTVTGPKIQYDIKDKTILTIPSKHKKTRIVLEPNK